MSETVVNIDDDALGPSPGDTGGLEHRQQKSFQEQAQDQVKANVTAYLMQAGKEQAKRAFSVYGNIDILRPYFEIEPKELRLRLARSFVPAKPGGDKVKVHAELYGPLMVILTLVALLLFEMKSSDHSVKEGTLMGTALFICFGYWFGASSLAWSMAYLSSCRISYVQLLSMTGYALTSHCVVTFIGTIFHTSHDHLLFYVLWAVLGGLTSLRMVTILLSRGPNPKQRLMLCGSVVAVHMLFLLYLHFAYHTIVTELSSLGEDSKIIRQVGNSAIIGETQKTHKIQSVSKKASS